MIEVEISNPTTRRRLIALASRRLRDRDEAEDCVQEAFFLARRKWPQCADQAKQNSYAWWYRVARDCLPLFSMCSPMSLNAP